MRNKKKGKQFPRLNAHGAPLARFMNLICLRRAFIIEIPLDSLSLCQLRENLRYTHTYIVWGAQFSPAASAKRITREEKRNVASFFRDNNKVFDGG